MKRGISDSFRVKILSQGEEKMKKKLHVLVLSLFIVSVLFFSPAALSEVETNGVVQVDDSSLAATGYVPGDIRVAIYDEPNMTTPSYPISTGGKNNNVTGLMNVLVSYGYDVTLLDVQDIYNHELTTANYDVFCMVDNFPRENITYRVMDFWLGGGGLLVFDGSAGFLCSFGVLPPEAIGTSGSPAYWSYASDDFVFTGLHPVSKSVNGSINTVSSSYFLWDFLALQATSIGPDLTKVATSSISPNDATILAYEPSDRGGKVVTIAMDLVNDQLPELYPIYADAVEWLAPKPKARILYDLTHQPWCPTDTWEWAGDGNYLTTWRNDLVSRSFTVDKLHPSAAGNLTSDNLAPYDLLVTNQPLLSFSTPEIAAVDAWVSAGGGLFVIGDNPGVPDNYHLDDLIAPYGFQFNDTVAPYSTGVGIFDMHPTTEVCTSLVYQGATNLILSGGAYPIWSYAPGEVAAGASEYGAGRVVVICDANSVLDSWIGGADNEQFAMNVANWLTTSSARVLLFHDSTGIFPYNFYRSAVADALNELDIEFMLTFDRDYFNLSLNSRDWELVISDANSASPVVNYGFILDHLMNGGKLIMRDFLFRYPNGSNGWDLSLYTYMGFEGAGATAFITSGAPTVYMWDDQHSVFDRPVDFAVDRFESTANFYTTDFTNVTLHANATAIAGITPTPEVNQSAIVLGAGGRALCNMFSISQYTDDYDESTYADNFEIWLNEIAYMMRPTIESPGDLVFDLGEYDELLWNAYSYGPSDYQIKRDSVIIATQAWDGSTVTLDISSLPVGVYEFELTVRDIFAYQAEDTITVTIEEPPTPTTPTEPTTTPTALPPGGFMILVIAAAAGVVIIIVIFFLMKKKKT
jgi:hypothetical protein